jgi:FixJ family two-component response regulator
VFVIGDDAFLRGALDSLLRSVGLDVRVFASPQEFMHTERPDSGQSSATSKPRS